MRAVQYVARRSISYRCLADFWDVAITKSVAVLKHPVLTKRKEDDRQYLLVSISPLGINPKTTPVLSRRAPEAGKKKQMRSLPRTPCWDRSEGSNHRVSLAGRAPARYKWVPPVTPALGLFAITFQRTTQL